MLATLAAAGLLARNDVRDASAGPRPALAEGRQLISWSRVRPAGGRPGPRPGLTDRSRIRPSTATCPAPGNSVEAWTRSAGGRRAEMAEELHGLADHVRLLHGTDLTPTGACAAWNEGSAKPGMHATGSWRGSKGA